MSTSHRSGSNRSVRDVWSLLENIGFEPYIVVGDDDFEEILGNGGKLLKEGYARFDPEALLGSKLVSGHVKAFIAELDC